MNDLRYNSLGQNSYYPPPPSASPPQQYQSNNYAAPTGAAPPSHYHQTAAGYRPPDESQQGYTAPYGPAPSQCQRIDAFCRNIQVYADLRVFYSVRPPTQTQQYGPQMQSQGGGQVQPYFQYSQCTFLSFCVCFLVGSPDISGDNRYWSKESALCTSSVPISIQSVMKY